MTGPEPQYLRDPHAHLTVTVEISTPRGNQTYQTTYLATGATVAEAVARAHEGAMLNVRLNAEVAAQEARYDDDGHRLYYAEDKVPDYLDTGAVIDRNNNMWVELATGEEWPDTLWLLTGVSFINTSDWHELAFPVRVASETWTAGG